MKKIRIIPRLDVKGPNVVKGIQMEGLRVVGKPDLLAKKYYESGADEIIYIDIVASLYERNNLLEVVENTTSNGIFIPITVGGGIRTIEDIKKLLRAGADKVAINTAAIRNPGFINQASRMFGSQCIVGSIEAKYHGEDKWENYIDCGRERTNLDAIEWAKKLVELGAGELLVTSVDKEGTRKGYDVELIKKISSVVDVPVIACGGASNEADILNCLEVTRCDAVAFGTILHYNETSIDQVKAYLKKNNFLMREKNEWQVEQPNINNKKTLSVIDYGAGNLQSVVNAFRFFGNKVKIIENPEEILKSSLLVLPGDGAFGYAMQELKNRGFIEPIKKYIKNNKPFLGICLGMQVLMSESFEFGHHKGLDIIQGKVVPFKPKKEVKDTYYRIPHMGWNKLTPNNGFFNEFISNKSSCSEAYFIHSYYVYPENPKNIVAITTYGEQKFCSILRRDSLFATQFHPEKSGALGMSIIQYFSSL
ncbi:imidazole glycerol phosphate synthase subunit HisF [Candidatus Woesearchaeota archaeon]|nr:imidazole glycerol phosphate synthase subunit HisF [Candidatus Woesearchaeota archaeon]